MDFAVIIHPVQHSDMYDRFLLSRYLPPFLMDTFLSILPPLMPPQGELKVNCQGSQGSMEVSGQLVGCPLTTRQLLQLPSEVVLNKVLKCVRKAQKNGARIIGLDGVAGLAADKEKVARLTGVPVTAGESLTVVMALESARMAAQEKGLVWHKTNVALLGAENPPGYIFARLIAREVGSLTLLTRRAGIHEKLIQAILYDTGLAVGQRDITPSSLESTQMVIILEPFSDQVLDPMLFQSGTIVCDFLAPYGMALSLASSRADLLVLQGSTVEIPGIGEVKSPFNNIGLGFSPLMAEIILLALEAKDVSFIGDKEININQVEEMAQLAKKYGFRVKHSWSPNRTVTGLKPGVSEFLSRREYKGQLPG